MRVDANEGWTTAESRESPSTDAVDVDADAVIQLPTFAVKKLDLPRERQARRAAGKRTSTKSQTKRGRYVRSSQTEKVTDVAPAAVTDMPASMTKRPLNPVVGTMLPLVVLAVAAAP